MPAALQTEGVLGLGIQSAANDSWLVAHVVDSSGKFHFVDLLGQATIGDADARPAANKLPLPPGEGQGVREMAMPA